MKPLPSSPRRFAGGDADVGERQLRGVLGGHADLLEVAATLEAGGVALDDDEAEAVGAGVRVGLADDDHQVAHDAVGDERLLTVDDPLVALADGAGLDALQVRAGAGLGHRDGGDHLAGAEARQPALLLLVVRQLVQVRRDDVVVQREAEPARARAGDLLGDDPLEAQVGRPAAAVLLGDVHGEQAGLPGGQPDVPADVALLLPLRVVRDGLLLQEVPDHLPEVGVLVGEDRSLHRVAPPLGTCGRPCGSSGPASVLVDLSVAAPPGNSQA